jgi:SAM-dependent methyltransferase
VSDASNGLLSNRLKRYVLFDRENRPYLRWQMSRFLPHLGRRILEIGCGVGGIIDLLPKKELILGVDIDEEVLAYAAERHRNREECRFEGLDFAALREDQARLASLRFDTIVCINLLEHIEDDVAALETMRAILVPGGVLALLVPAHPALYGEYDATDGHFRRYTKRELREKVRRAGFTPDGLRHFNAVGAVGWWVKYKLLRSTIHGSTDFRLMNAMLPILDPLERVIPPPFGLSLTTVARRDGD